jgi:hypothetical protein
MGIKLFEFGRRRDGLTADEFHARWAELYSGRQAGDPTLARHVQRCELNHRLAEDYVRDRYRPEGTGAGWDGVAVTWFDSLAALEAWQAEPAHAAFVDAQLELREPEQLVVVTHDPEPIVDKPERTDAGAKMVCILHRNAALDLATFHEHWLHHHGGLFQRIPELNEPLLAYDQNHGIDLPDADFDGVTEQWFTSYATFLGSLGVPAVETEVNPDVAHFLDQSSIEFVMAGPPTVVVGH